MAHIAVVLTWLSGMHFHGSYFSNYSSWIKDPVHVLPSAQSVWHLVGQEILNGDVGGYHQGVYITSGLFHLWRTSGITNISQLKVLSIVLQLIALLLLIGSYLHMKPVSFPTYSSYSKIRSVNIHHILLLSGLGSISWSGHQVHVSIPMCRLLDSGIDPSVIPSAASMIGGDNMSQLFPSFGRSITPDFTWTLPSDIRLLADIGLVEVSSGSIHMGQIAAHHFYVGLALIISSCFLKELSVDSKTSSSLASHVSRRLTSHLVLAVGLAITGSLSIITAHHLTAIPIYGFLSSDYPTVTSAFVHHMWIGSLLLIGSASHASIHMIRDYLGTPQSLSKIATSLSLLSHRDSIIAHLAWVTIFLGLHAFGLFIHNDSVQALGRIEDMVADNSISVKPIFVNLLWESRYSGSSLYISIIEGRVITAWQELGTSDFLIHHIHAFTIHVTVLILVKGVLNARGSRLVSDKHNLGFRYPCDGPGRGGTCQISPWDHIFLAMFWSYNSISIAVFHFYWKMQADIWGSYEVSTSTVSHITGGDFSYSSMTINAWLTNFLWSQSAQVIQSYGSSNSAYGLIFLGAHFTWALSLMFLYSGRGYWQELIESIVWSHNKLHLTVEVQPRALSITQGRAVGLVHYILGGIATTWSFILCRIVAITS